MLLTQWNAIEMLSNILFTNHIVSIAAIRRAPVGTEVPAATPGMPVVHTGEDSKDLMSATIRDNPTDITRTLPFELEFVTDTPSLRGILGALETSPRFFVVRSVAVLNTRSGEMQQGGRNEGMGKTATPTGPPEGAPPGAPAVVKPAAALKVIVFGEEKIQVKLRVDLVEFREPSAPAGK